MFARPGITLALMMLLPGCVCTAPAQEMINNASVTGQVVDPTGAVIPHATITALQSATNETSHDDG